MSKALFTGFRWFLDVSTAMLDSRGKPRRDLFKWDGLHPNAECYALWTSIIRPVLMELTVPRELSRSRNLRQVEFMASKLGQDGRAC